MHNVDRAFTELLGHEGSYSNHPADPGGETMWGITIAVARENGYAGEMKDMPQSVAKAIYRKRYWLDIFDQTPYRVAFQVFDGAVNSGVVQSVKWLQRAVGVKDDGQFGPITLRAVQAASPANVVLLFNAERLLFMSGLSTWASFGRGWARRIAGNLRAGAE